MYIILSNIFTPHMKQYQDNFGRNKVTIVNSTYMIYSAGLNSQVISAKVTKKITNLLLRSTTSSFSFTSSGLPP